MEKGAQGWPLCVLIIWVSVFFFYCFDSDIWIILMLMQYSVFFIFQIWVKFTKRLIKLSLWSCLNVEKPLKAFKRLIICKKRHTERCLISDTLVKTCWCPVNELFEKLKQSMLESLLGAKPLLIFQLKRDEDYNFVYIAKGNNLETRLTCLKREDNHDHQVEDFRAWNLCSTDLILAMPWATGKF